LICEMHGGGLGYRRTYKARRKLVTVDTKHHGSKEWNRWNIESTRDRVGGEQHVAVLTELKRNVHDLSICRE
jgi:hypothetical protein